MPKLIEMYEILFDEKFSDAHDASYDVNATAKCFFELVRKEEYSNEDLNSFSKTLWNMSLNLPS